MANPTKLQLQEKVKSLKLEIAELNIKLEKVEANSTPNAFRKPKLSFMGGVDKTLLKD